MYVKRSSLAKNEAIRSQQENLIKKLRWATDCIYNNILNNNPNQWGQSAFSYHAEDRTGEFQYTQFPVHRYSGSLFQY